MVMQMRNRDFASNGDIGYICTSTQGEDGLLVEVDFGDDRVVAYEDIEALRQLELAYATTIHKSQGSEYDAVLINIQDMHGKMLNRALFYTAETVRRSASSLWATGMPSCGPTDRGHQAPAYDAGHADQRIDKRIGG